MNDRHRQFRQGLSSGLRALALPTRLRFGLSHLLPTEAACSPGQWLGGPRPMRGFFPASDERGVPADMSQQLLLHKTRHQGLMNSFGHPVTGEFCRRPGKCGLGRKFAPRYKTADSSEVRRSPQGLDGGPGGGGSIRLTHKGPGHGLALPRFPAEAWRRPTGKFLDLEQLQEAN